jgi:steroid 5-alpha reductase family enzyme
MVSYLGTLAAIALSLSFLMAGAWMVQQRTGNSGWVDTIWTFWLGLVGPGSTLWPVGSPEPNASERNRDYLTRTSASFPLPPHKGVVT